MKKLKKWLLEIGIVSLGLAALVFFFYVSHMITVWKDEAHKKKWGKRVLSKVYIVSCDNGYAGFVESWRIDKATYELVDQNTNFVIERLGENCTMLVVHDAKLDEKE